MGGWGANWGAGMARETNKLTMLAIKNSPDGKLFDGGGLTLIKSDTAGRWIYRYSFMSKRREMGLGSLPVVSLADARKFRDRWAAVLAGGSDPIQERDRARQDEKAARDKIDPTFEQMTRTVFEARKSTLRDDGKRGRWISPLECHIFPKIGRIRITEMHQSDIAGALSPIWKTKHETALKAISRIKIVFTQARLMGADVDPFTVDAARHILGHVDHQSTPIAATRWQDIPTLYAKLNKNTPSHLALRWMILTSVRSEAARGARFDEIQGDVWTISKDRIKGRRGRNKDFRTPLSNEALKVLQTCIDQAHNEHLFPSPRVGFISHNAIAKILNNMEEEGRPHGFRTSFRTWVQDTNAATYDVAETALGHAVGSKIERVYARSDLLDQRRMLAERWACYVTGEQSAIIIPIIASL